MTWDAKIAVANRKGGVAKNTTAVNLPAALSLANYKILLIDTDSHNAIALNTSKR